MGHRLACALHAWLESLRLAATRSLHVPESRFPPCSPRFLSAGTAQADTANFFFQDSAYRSTADIPGRVLRRRHAIVPRRLRGRQPRRFAGHQRRPIIGGLGGFDGIRDRVDADDGTLDSACGPQTSKCHDWFYGSGATGLDHHLHRRHLPTAFAVVWTDGTGSVTFSAKDGGSNSPGSIVKSGFADGSFWRNHGRGSLLLAPPCRRHQVDLQ